MKREPAWKAKRAIFVFVAAWTALVVLIPFALAPGSVGDLSGSVGEVDNDHSSLDPLSQAIYYFGDLYCHTKAERSFELNGNQMPFCARDVGLFAGIAGGMAIMLFYSPRFSWLAVILLALPLVIDGGVQLVFEYESNNAIRMATGLLGGFAAAWFLSHMADVILSVKR